jgi:membrane-associated phospholipid phosphatase
MPARTIVERVRALSALVCAIVFLVGAPRVARAEPPPPGVSAIAYDTRVDVSVTAVLASWVFTAELLKAQLVPEKCRWCYRADDGADALNPVDGAVRRTLLWKDTHAAGVTSDVIAFGVLPAGAIGLEMLAANNDNAIKGAPVDALVITEATLVAATVNQLVKFAFARERPFVHYLPRSPEGLRALTDSPSDDNLSFYSGHTNLAFAIATSSGTVATLRGYSLAPVVWASGLALATAVGYLRIAADKHYLSDVLTGVVVGSILGVGVPFVLHPREDAAP